jgi:hypothetical protein
MLAATSLSMHKLLVLLAYYDIGVKGLFSSIFYKSIIQDTGFAIYPEKIRKRRVELIRLE